MKAFTKKFVTVLATFAAALTLIAGCTGGGAGGGTNAPNAPTNEGGEAVADSGGGELKDKYDPPVTITTVWGVDPALKFKNGETIENNVATKWALDMFGINIKSLWSVTDTNGAFATKLRLAMSSRQEMPDVIVVGDNLLAQDLIDSGIFQEAGPLFDRYASETWKAAMELDSHVWDPYIRDGKRMGIPILDYAYNHDYMLWIRQDWLDKLGLQPPNTIDELEAVMDAFKNNNPDGLKPDEVTPLSIGFKDTMNTWMGSPSWVFGAYGTIPNQWNVSGDGSLEYGSTSPAMKQGLAKLKEWHEKGYIPKEAALWDANKTAEPAVAGTAGIIPGPYWMSGWPLSDTANVPEGSWKPHVIPAGPDGKAGRPGTHFTNGVILINKDMKHPEALFTYQNYIFENLANPPAGSQYEIGLFKGYDYDLDANGEPIYGDDIEGGSVNVVRYLLIRDGARIPDAQMKALLSLADGNEPTTRLEKEVTNNYGKETPAAAKVLLSQEDISHKNMFTGPPTETMKSKLDYLNKLENQTFNEIIYGEKPIDAFDAFVESWMSGGGSDITKEVNEWYANINQ